MSSCPKLYLDPDLDKDLINTYTDFGNYPDDSMIFNQVVMRPLTYIFKKTSESRYQLL